MPIKSRIKTIPNYPKEGIMFRDITSLLQDPQGFRKVVDELIYPFVGRRVDKVAGIEARGFILGGAVAHQLSVGFVPVRKAGKLPRETVSESYELEYGNDKVELHADAVQKGENVLLVDDLIATGGTATAAARLITKLGGNLVGCSFVIDLPDLGGKKRLEEAGHQVLTLVEFSGH